MADNAPRLEILPDEAPAERPTPLRPRLELFTEPPAAPPVRPTERLREMGQAGLGALAAAGAEAVRSVPSVVVGGLPSVEAFALKDVPEFARNLYITGKEKLDFISPAEAERQRQEPPQWLPRQTEAQTEGYLSPLTGEPTYKGVRETIKRGAEKFGFSAIAEEPKTPGQKIAAEAVKGAAMGMPGAARSAIGRIASGAGAGAAGEAAGQVTEGQPNEGFFRLVSALGGGLAGAKAANVLLPAIRGRDELAAALERDISTGQLKMTPEQVRQAIAAGRPLTPMDVAGPHTLEYMRRAAGTSSLNESRAQQFNAMIAERSAESGSRIRADAESVLGRQVNADAFQKMLEEAGGRTRDQVFGIARANPNANAIPPALTAPLESRPAVQEAMRRADVAAKNLTIFDIRPPQPGRPGTADRWAQTPVGLRLQPGAPAVPAQPGNLNYWHQVDRKLGDMIAEAKSAGKNTEATEYSMAQKDLRQRLYTHVPEYETALGVSAKTFQGQSAPEAGFNFAQMVFTAKKNPFVRGDVKREFAAMPPENREALAHGVAHFLVQKAESGGIGQLAKKIREDRNFQQDIRTILGPERYDRIAGSILAEDVLRKMPAVSAAQPRFSAGTIGLGAGLGEAAAEVALTKSLPQLLSQQAVAPETLTRALVAAGLGMGATAVHRLQERRVANAIIPMMLSRDPKQLAEFSRLLDGSAIARKIFNNMTTTLDVAYNQARAQAEKEDAPRATGGRIFRASGGAVNLKALANAAKRAVCKSTEDLLQAPDAHVVQALKVATQHI
jgi:hypothetical protein